MTRLIKRISPEGQVKSGRGDKPRAAPGRARHDQAAMERIAMNQQQPAPQAGSTPSAIASVDDILGFWFGPPPVHTRDEWFRKDDAFDAEIRHRFLCTVEAAGRGDCDDWASTAHGALALVVVLDQFPRNLFRNDARTYACDGKALAVANAALAAGLDQALAPQQQLFLYLPFEHSEALADQQRALQLMAHWQQQPALSGFYRYAVMHHDVIARFGRFPHRNAILQRTSTPAEAEYLAQPGSGF
ncbi:hypothetical protein IGB42_02409 [Andreprevotia sp. IGB-42]|uniref:DUF924 family protein n=1 Tax=Andreprevotia sp. IGB-42 TaxID=2497473 RepID=UPI00157E4B38|nr:DUF924 family protein [Andreprevotia sp. IGB-42]KAF0813013.1 hypothetical protein IGB42_02409 [Andreprevotia sp. IGB-42]